MTDEGRPSPGDDLPSYPTGPETNQVSAPAQLGPAPKPVSQAALLMVISAVLSIAGSIYTLARKNSILNELVKKNTIKASERSAASNSLVVGVIIGLVIAALYIGLAYKVRGGSRWARTVTIILATLGILSGLLSLSQNSGVIAKISGIISLVLAVAILGLLVSKPAKQFFAKPPLQ